MTLSHPPTTLGLRPGSPASDHRTLSWVIPNLVLSGDLPFSFRDKLQHLTIWESAGITDVLDVREEANDSEVIRAHSVITPHWLGIDDCDSAATSAWFKRVIEVGETVLSNPESVLLVHCHMGVNRGPSAAFAILLAQGWNPVTALEEIRAARPFTGILYAPQAAYFHALTSGASMEEANSAFVKTSNWLEENLVDVPWVIRQIGSRTA